MELQHSPDDPLIQRRQAELRQHLQTVETKLVAGKRVRARIRWKLKGDMVSSEFFKAVREKASVTAITSLRDSNGVLVFDSTGLGEILHRSTVISTRTRLPLLSKMPRGGDYRNFRKPREIKNRVNLICLG